MRYVRRPPLAQERVALQEDGLVRLSLERAFADGTVASSMDPLALLCGLATSVPPPRFHSQVRGGAGLREPPTCARKRIGPRPAKQEAPAKADDEPAPKRNLRFDHAAAIAAGTALTVLALQTYFFLLAALDLPFIRYWTVFEEAGWRLWSAFVLMAAVPAVVEELAFRGLIYEGLSLVMTRREALLVQAMAFSVLHLSPWVFASHFLMGFSLGLLRDATRSLYPCMLAHAAWNAWIVAEESGLLRGPCRRTAPAPRGPARLREMRRGAIGTFLSPGERC